MPIPESQLATWAQQGATTQISATYNTIKNALEERQAPYASKANFDVYLQGSYNNDTNVWRDSDVDLVIEHRPFFHDMSRLNPFERVVATNALTGTNPYSYSEFKREVTDWLRVRFPGFVTPTRKVVEVRGNGTSRRDADVLICAKYHEYRRFNSPTDNDIRVGVRFTTSDGQAIVNFPKLHGEACTYKHIVANNNFKPLVRIYKNMRNRMIDDGLLADGVAPSYYIEGMLHNVPPILFTTNRAQSFRDTFTWLRACNRNSLLCAHQQRPLLGDGLPDSWPSARYDAFLRALAAFWDTWR